MMRAAEPAQNQGLVSGRHAGSLRGFLGLLQTALPPPGHPHLDLQGRSRWTSRITGRGGRRFKGSPVLCCGDGQASRDPQKPFPERQPSPRLPSLEWAPAPQASGIHSLDSAPPGASTGPRGLPEGGFLPGGDWVAGWALPGWGRERVLIL